MFHENHICMKPTISIITPAYNAERTINDTIQSVLNQTFDDWELIIVDDCSTDNTPNIVKDYMSYDKRVKYFTTECASGGPSVPRNLGIIKSKGDYIAFLDSDDLWLPNKLQEQLSFLVGHNYKFVYSNYEKISCEGKRSNRIIKGRDISTYQNTLKSCEIPCLTVLVDRKIIENRRFKNVGKEDYIMWLELLKSGNIAYNTQKVHALYREAKETRSSNKFKMIYEQWNVIRNIEKQNVVKSIYFICVYLIKGYMKYVR